ncbi:SlyX family protein [Ignatzschineria rhizosphaerae]|uniref:Protein SlyX homolog n=1 Tax=Ignatzschineria rhizosphaerae TaxID=2923279 RepID=A0ABY3X5Q4_9GAMM|nr:SlyX family protein [Ignatzschineria rhizosphaerae]UNM97084.1 SlyX family protein [Ignatzschineria rhizosphaerae]
MSDKELTLEAQVKDLASRVMELESREAFHEYTVENLNQTIIRQQEMLDRLVRVSQQLIDKVKEMPSSEEKAWSADEEVPPHY